MTAKRGDSFRNERSLSSASATRYRPRPSLALLPNELTRPPMTAVGSRPAMSSTSAIIEVVVVLPCAPATAMPWRRLISSASSSARGTTARPRSRAAAISGFVARTADEYTTTSASLDVARVVALCNARAQRLEPIGDVGALHVRPAYLVSEIHQQLCDSAHPDAADADEMNAPGLPEHTAHERRLSVNRITSSTMSSAARGLASARAAADIRRRCSRSPASASMRPASRSPVSSRLLHHLRGPGSLQRKRVVALVIVGRGRQRNQNRRPAGRRHLRQRRRARARHDEPRGLHLSVHRIDEPFHAALHAVPFERRSNHVEVPCPRLADEIERFGCGSQLRRRLHHGHVDCVRALRAAKD